MHVWNLLHAARWKFRRQKVAKKSPSGHHRTTLSGYIFATKARIDNRKKTYLAAIISSTCPHNLNFGPLVAEIGPVVWDTPANFNGFRVLTALLHGTSSGRQPNFAATLNRGRQLYSAGRPSRWAFSHILVINITVTSCRHLATAWGEAIIFYDFILFFETFLLVISLWLWWYQCVK